MINNKSTVKKQKISVLDCFGALIGIIIYKLTLELIYIKFIATTYAYMGFNYNVNSSKYFVSWIVCLVASSFIITLYKRNEFSSMVVVLLYLMAFIPGIILMAFMQTEFFTLYLIYWTMMFIVQFCIPHFKFSRVSNNVCNKVLLLVVIIFSAIVIFISWHYTGFRIQTNIIDVYGIREEARLYNMPAILQYAFSTSRIIIPTFIIYFLSLKKNKIVVFLVFIQLLIFSVDGSKTVFFSLICGFAGYMMFIKYQRLTRWFSCLLIIINLCGYLEQLVRHKSYIIDSIIRRVLFIPQLLNYKYYDFFSMNEFDLFRQGILGRLGFSSPYINKIPNIIGGVYFNNYSTSSNNGLFSDAYYNLGVAGMFIMPILIILALRLLEACMNGLSISVLIASVVTATMTFISSSFFTVMLTHGFIALCVIIYFLPRNGSDIAEIKTSLKKEFTL
jgi:hypothetical protein